MVTFLREQNEALMKRVEQLKRQQAGPSGAPSTTPSSWEFLDGEGEVNVKRRGSLNDS